MTTVHEPTAAVPADLAVWPASVTDSPSGDLAVGGVPLAEIADRFGTPVYVFDEAEVRPACTSSTASPCRNWTSAAATASPTGPVSGPWM